MMPTTMATQSALRTLVLRLLDGGAAHVRAEDALEGLPVAARGVRPEWSPHSAWEILEHMRIAQQDILRYCLDPAHQSPQWPDGYWPPAASPASGAWEESERGFLADLRAVRELVASTPDLLQPIPHAPDASVLQEVFLVANHNSYHLGQLMLVRRTVSGPDA
jgi:hypothetical protein